MAEAVRYHFRVFSSLVAKYGRTYDADIRVLEFNPCSKTAAAGARFRFRLAVVLTDAETGKVWQSYEVNIDDIRKGRKCDDLSLATGPTSAETLYAERGARLAVAHLFGGRRIADAPWSGHETRNIKPDYPVEYGALKRRDRCDRYRRLAREHGLDINDIPKDKLPFYCRY